jgi:hypothetical protein
VRADHDRRAAGGQQHRDEAFALAPGQPGEIAQRAPASTSSASAPRAWVSVRARSIRASRSAGEIAGARSVQGDRRSSSVCAVDPPIIVFPVLMRNGQGQRAPAYRPAPCPRSCPRPAAR